MKIYKNLDSLPQKIRETFLQDIKKFTPIERFEFIIKIGKSVWASDVHIIPVPYSIDAQHELVKVKFRIDGDLDNYIYNLSEKLEMDVRSYILMSEYKQFVYAIKDNLNLPANNTFEAWDAQYHFDLYSEAWDLVDKIKLRVNVMPTWIEILDNSNNKNKISLGKHQCITSRIINDGIDSLPSFQDLKIIPSVQKKLLSFIHGWNGTLVVSWPTGSWKSVLLQVLLSRIANEKIKISTLEDPIEYINPYLVQTQIAKNKGFDWVHGLMALMRQDPDVIMVWEVRNEDVAKLTFELSTTWHMTYTTTHAKSWAWAYDRFRQMGIPNYIISSITVSVGARLSKKLCSHCKTKVEDKDEIMKLENIFEAFFPWFDFTQSSAEDLCFFINDNELQNKYLFQEKIDTLRMLTKQIQIETTSNKKAQLENHKKMINTALLKWFKDFFVKNAYKRKSGGCEHCFWKWVKGRIWVHEFIFMTKELEQLILENTPQKHIENYIRRIDSTITLERNWLIKMMRWEIDYEELLQLNVNND